MNSVQTTNRRGRCPFRWFVFNKALALQKERHEHSEKKPGYTGMCRLLIGWRNSAETE
ncbi:Uncharacterised protein [Citrobacter freundii]|nr:Uncharacterised protein [Citrobacter freundii]